MKHTTAKKLIKSQEGFTLIELLVVIGILAILLAITLIAINPARQFAQGRDTERKNTMTQLLNAIGGYFADHGGTLPTGVSGISNYTKISGDTWTGLCGDIVPRYIPAVKQDPSTTGSRDLTSTDCTTTTLDTGYWVTVTTGNRVTVSSTSEVGYLDDNSVHPMYVTR